MSEYDPSQFRQLPSHLQDKLVSIRTQIDEAYQVISSDSRREYRKQKVEELLIVQSAALLSKKGEMAIMRHDRPEAVSCFAKAVELVPGSGEYKDGLRRASAIALIEKGAPVRGAQCIGNRPPTQLSDALPSGSWYERANVRDPAVASGL